MKTSHNLRDSEEAQQILQQGLWLQRVQIPAAATVRPALRWSLELVSSGQPLPPIGFVVDLGHAALGTDWESRENRDMPPLPGLPPGLLRTYEDHVLGKLYADWTFARASDVLRLYQDQEQVRGQARRFGLRPDSICRPCRLHGRGPESRSHQGAVGASAPGCARSGLGCIRAETAFILCWRNCTSR